MYEQIAILYEQLEQAKHTRNFIKYGFANTGQNAHWLKHVRALYANNLHKATSEQLTCCASLEMLGTSYANSKTARGWIVPAHVIKLQEYIYKALNDNNALMPKPQKKGLKHKLLTLWKKQK